MEAAHRKVRRFLVGGKLLISRRAGGSIRKIRQQLQALAGMSAVDGVGGERNGLGDAISVPGCHECGGGVQHNDIAAGGALALQHGANDGGILLRVATADSVERG